MGKVSDFYCNRGAYAELFFVSRKIFFPNLQNIRLTDYTLEVFKVLKIKHIPSFLCLLLRVAEINIKNRLDIDSMENKKTGQQLPSTHAGDGGEAMEKTEDNPISDGPKKAQKPQDAGWYVAVVRVNCEKRIAIDIQDVLDNKAIWFEYWVPTKRTFVVDRRTNKRKEKDRVFLSTFIFCHVSRKDLNEIRFRSDVYKMLTMPGSKDIYRIPDAELENYRQFVECACEEVSAYTAPLKKGQKVRIFGGNMQGIEAYVQRVKGKRAVIGCEIKYIAGATIEIDRELLQIIED